LTYSSGGSAPTIWAIHSVTTSSCRAILYY
jgi:hypothetical protein